MDTLPLFNLDPGPAVTGRQWQLHIPAPCKWVTANQINNSHYRFTRAKLTKQWRQATADAADNAGLPTGLDLVRIDAIARFAGRAPVRDRDNLRPTVKAAIDGLTPARTFTRNGKMFHSPGHGLIPDDNDRHLAGTDITIERLPTGALPPAGELILIIKEIPR